MSYRIRYKNNLILYFMPNNRKTFHHSPEKCSHLKMSRLGFQTEKNGLRAEAEGLALSKTVTPFNASNQAISEWENLFPQPRNLVTQQEGLYGGLIHVLYNFSYKIILKFLV